MPFDGSQLDDVTKLLIEGRERIEQGWCQRRTRHRGAVCAVGALYPTDYGIFLLAVQRLGRAAGLESVDCGEIPHWNDAPERTKAEVLAVYDSAIAQIT